MTPTPRTVAEHVAHVLALVAPLAEQRVALADLADAPGPPAVLARDVHAADPVPAFDHSAMDGYAVRTDSLPVHGTPVTLQVVADIAAAPNTPAPLAPHTAARIMTGAPLPPGADAVVPVEHTSTGRFDPTADTHLPHVTLSRQPRNHIRRQGADIAPAALLAAAGTELTAPVIAALAASGVTHAPVRRRPLVAVIATGSELVPLGETIRPGQIHDSNSLMLAAAIRTAGADVVRGGPVPDTPHDLAAALDAAHDGALDPTGRPADLIVTAGGVSAGAADVVRALLTAPDPAVTHAELAAVGMKPGRPQALAQRHGTPWIAVPGTPVAAYVSCAMFVRPAIRRLRGLADPAGPVETRPAAVGWAGPRGREQVLPVRVDERGVTPTGDGHHLSALIAADALAVVRADVEKVAPGDPVSVIPL